MPLRSTYNKPCNTFLSFLAEHDIIYHYLYFTEKTETSRKFLKSRNYLIRANIFENYTVSKNCLGIKIYLHSS